MTQGVRNEFFHYTQLASLWKIASSGIIWATNARYLNDRSERTHSLDLLSGAAEELYFRASTKPSREFLSTIAHSIAGAMYETYVACFCEEEDLLSQWRSYGNGYALGLDSYRLLSGRWRYGCGSEDISAFASLRRVSYGVNETIELMKGALLTSLVLLEQNMDEFDQDALPLDLRPDHAKTPQEISASRQSSDERIARLQNIWWKVIGNAQIELMTIMHGIKNPVFLEEREWRLVVSLPKESEERLVQFREGPGYLIPYVPVSLVQDDGSLPFSSIIIGPTLDQELAEDSLRMFLKGQNLERIAVRRSQIPLR